MGSIYFTVYDCVAHCTCISHYFNFNHLHHSQLQFSTLACCEITKVAFFKVNLLKLQNMNRINRMNPYI